MAGKIAAISTAATNIVASTKAVPAPAKGVPAPNTDNKFEDALSRAMPAAKDTPSKDASAKSAASKSASPKPQEAQSTQPEQSIDATEAEASAEAAESLDSVESPETERLSKPSARKSSRSTEDQNEPAASSDFDIDLYADVAAIAANQANPTGVVPNDRSLSDVEASNTIPSSPEIQSIVPFSTQAVPDDTSDNTAVTLPNTDVRPVLEEPTEELLAPAKPDIPIPAEQDAPVAVESGILIEVKGVAEEVEVEAPATSEIPSLPQEPTAARSAQNAPPAYEEKRIAAAKSDKQPLADPIISSESEQATQVLPGDQATDADGQSAQGNWAGDQDSAMASDRPLPREAEPAPAKPEPKLGQRVPADPAIMPAPVSHTEQSPKPATALAPPSLESRFAEVNHPKIVTAVRSELVPNGGTMQIRLDPPELGALQVRVEMRDGVLAASFQTVNDDATQLLSHSLHQLKTALESQGVSVERLHVEQVPREKLAGGMSDDGQQQRQPQDHASQQEQQRREMLQRMWRRLAGDKDPLDLMA